MIKVENIDVYGFEAAIRGMRNPKNSWDRSDSFECDGEHCIRRICNYSYCTGGEHYDDNECMLPDGVNYVIGPNDLDLMQRLYKAGTEHRKYLRMINVTMDITAPLYWWKEFDTYKIGTVANSCSTMHKIHDKEFTIDDFSHEHLSDDSLNMLHNHLIIGLNNYRNDFIKAKNKSDWWQMIQMLPTSYNQKRTVQLSYETVFNIIRQREHHKLDEWPQFVDILKQLPYVEELYKYGVNKLEELMNDIRNKAIDEFAEKLCDICFEESMTVVFEDKVKADILTVDGITEIIWELAEQMKAGVKNG